MRMKNLYRRFLILGVLSWRLAFFGLAGDAEPVAAAVCYQVCGDERGQCEDACPDDCSGTDEGCSDCIFQCAVYYERCMRTAIWCDNGGINYQPACQVHFGQHCDFNNPTNCHSGYYQTCNNWLGGITCVSCPNGQICGGLGPPSTPNCY